MPGQGQLLRLRGKSPLLKGRVGYLAPEYVLDYNSVAAPGAVGTRLFVAPARCKLAAGVETHTTGGAGSSKIYLRKHLAAHVAAPDAAASGANIVDLVDGGIPADATVNVAQAIVLVDTDDVIFEAGDKLMLVTPATLAGILIQLYITWSGRPVAA